MGVGIEVSVGRSVGSEVAVEEGAIAGVESEAGLPLPVPQAFSISKVINMYQ